MTTIDMAADYMATWDVNASLALREVAEEWHEGAWREYQEAKEQRARIAAAAGDGAEVQR